MTVLVTGVGGRIGRLVADTLHARGVEVRATSSRPRGSEAGYPVLAVDLNRPETLAPALAGVDALLLYVADAPPEALTGVLRDSGVRRVVVISSMSVEHPEMAAMAEHFLVAEQAVAASGAGWTFLRGDYFATNTLGWAAELRATGGVSLPYPDSYLEPVHEADLADLGVAALTTDDHVGRGYPLTGPETLTQAAMVATIGEVTGRPAEVRRIDPDVWRQNFVRYAPADLADSLLAFWRQADGVPGRTDRTVAAAGLRPRTFGEWVVEHRDAFAG